MAKSTKPQSKFKSFLFSPLSIFILAIILVFLAKGVIKLWGKYDISKDTRGINEERLESLRQQKQSLEEEIKKLSTPGGIEEELRSDLGVVAPGERVLQIVEEE